MVCKEDLKPITLHNRDIILNEDHNNACKSDAGMTVDTLIVDRSCKRTHGEFAVRKRGGQDHRDR